MTKQKEFLPRQDLWLIFCSCASFIEASACFCAYDLVLVQHIYMQLTVQMAQSPLVQNRAELKCQRWGFICNMKKMQTKISGLFCLFALTKALVVNSLFKSIVLYGYITAG